MDFSDFTEAIEQDQAISARLARKPGGRPARGYVGRNNVRFHCDGCGFFATTTAARLEKAGGCPTCVCGEPMRLSNLRDRVELSFTCDDAYADLAAMTPADRRVRLKREGFDNEAIMGFRDYLEPGHDGERTARANRCQWQYGYCHKYTSGTLCPEHAQDRYGRHA